jgi:hypothetical protein
VVDERRKWHSRLLRVAGADVRSAGAAVESVGAAIVLHRARSLDRRYGVDKSRVVGREGFEAGISARGENVVGQKVDHGGEIRDGGQEVHGDSRRSPVPCITAGALTPLSVPVNVWTLVPEAV